MRRFEKITGRSDDMLIIRGVNVFPSQFEELLLGDQRLSPHYVLEVRKQGALDALTLRVEPRNQPDDTARQAIASELAQHIRSLMGITVAIDVADIGGVARSEGKAQRVIDLRSPDTSAAP